MKRRDIRFIARRSKRFMKWKNASFSHANYMAFSHAVFPVYHKYKTKKEKKTRVELSGGLTRHDARP